MTILETLNSSDKEAFQTNAGSFQASQKPKLFFDMDGVLAEWKPIEIPVQIPSHKIQDYINERLYQKHYFKTLQPQPGMLEAAKQLVREGQVEVYILSCVLPQKEEYPHSTPQEDKEAWLSYYFPELPKTHWIFVPDGEPKRDSLPFSITKQDMLIDDYTKNLLDWELEGTGIKCINPFNDTHRTFQGARVYETDSPAKIVSDIYQALSPCIQKENQQEEEIERG